MGVVRIIIEFVMDILETIVFVGSLFIVVYLFILQPNQIKGASMEPTFYTSEYILTSKISYKFRSPQRGDIIVFKSPKNPDIEYIKRIIGLPGDIVLIKGSEVYVNNNLIQESYISSATNLWEGGFTKDSIPHTVPKNELYVIIAPDHQILVNLDRCQLTVLLVMSFFVISQQIKQVKLKIPGHLISVLSYQPFNFSRILFKVKDV